MLAIVTGRPGDIDPVYGKCMEVGPIIQLADAVPLQKFGHRVDLALQIMRHEQPTQDE